MPKIQVKKGSVFVDMTAMCDVSFLLLTFFILTAKAKPVEPVEVMTPSSIVEIPVPDVNVITIMVDKAGRIFMGMDNIDGSRQRWLDNLNTQFKMNITAPDQVNNFINGGVIPVSAKELPTFLAADAEAKKKMIETTKGIPADVENSDANELRWWIYNARAANQKAVVVVKGDKKAPYAIIKQVMKTLENQGVSRFSLLTSQGSRD
ncbi:MAG: ExbD/TolR family protein [Chitinophagales bacterium]|jgi:biopolymer transport protein ExbD|nr:biopolymer transporter ExbD [Sphingobacteriales bacterium]